MASTRLHVAEGALDMLIWKRSADHPRVQGAALVLVLWVVAGLSLVVLAGAHSMSSYARLASIELERLRSEAVLDSAISIFAQSLKGQPEVGKAHQTFELTLGETLVQVDVTPSKGLVDVNIASEDLLQAVLREIGGLSPGDATVMASRIKDWIDPDDQPSGVGGAEAPQYRAEKWPSMPRNAGLEDGSELLAVLGMTSDVYEKLRPFLGLNGQPQLDISSAPDELIDRLTGRQGLGAQIRHSAPEQKEAIISPYTSMPYFSNRSTQADRMVRITATLKSVGGLTWQRLVWIDRNERPDTLTSWTTLLVEPTRRLVMPLSN